ncbi:MAG TPA: pseudaminic acid biosynthesis-associated methylase [Chthoniobacteraceae bacterium]|jgi:pseudaminic acid biosynthesis-associated methylase
MQQLDIWRGDFGQAYTDRNIEDWNLRLPAFREILEGQPVRRVVEIGCNRGHNLVALSELLGDEAEVVGVEPNPYAQQLARTFSSKVGVLQGNVFDLPFKDGFFDLSFTAGVLIHIALEDLPRALAEIHRVSRRYILAMEYFAEEETAIPYQGRTDLLWKRDFLKHYQTQFPELRLVRQGFYGKDRGFDRTTYWLLEKPE